MSNVPANTVLIEDGQGRERREMLAQEVPVALVYNGLSHVVMMATPSDLEDLGIGFSLTEGIVDCLDEVRIVDCTASDHGLSLEMWLPQSRFDALAGRARNLTGRIGCGLCGSESLAQAIRPIKQVTASHGLGPTELVAAFVRLEASQPLNAESGAMHAAAILCHDGSLAVREDVGRHNAIDKAVGGVVRGGQSPRALLVTSRASYEVVHKAAQAGIGLVAAMSAPTALAVRMANEAGITLMGFVRGRRMTVYAGAISGPPAP